MHILRNQVLLHELKIKLELQNSITIFQFHFSIIRLQKMQFEYQVYLNKIALI